MHDTAVGSANFTECVPVPTGAGCGSPSTEEGLGRELTYTLQVRPLVIGDRLRA
jgi:hypothetical protein